MKGKWFFKKVIKTLIIKSCGLEYYLRKDGMKIGRNAHIYSDISTTESYLIELGDNVTISTGVSFITHDNSICKIDETKTDIFGKIMVGNNCFIGSRAIIMYGITLGNNCIVAAGSVVTKSFPGGVIIGGNPAKVIGNIKDLSRRMESHAVNITGLSVDEKRQVILNSNLIQK